MTRGDVVLAAIAGDYGKPRPALIVQTDRLALDHPSVILCPMTTHLVDVSIFRVRVEPSAANGLRQVSEVMTDKVATVPRRKLRGVIGRVDASTLRRVDIALRTVLDLI